jgi:hypothetical protein
MILIQTTRPLPQSNNSPHGGEGSHSLRTSGLGETYHFRFQVEVSQVAL